MFFIFDVLYILNSHYLYNIIIESDIQKKKGETIWVLSKSLFTYKILNVVLQNDISVGKWWYSNVI